MSALGAALAAFVAGWACRAWWGRRRWEAPLRSLTQTAERLARGDHDARAAVYPGSPLSGFAATMNLLAERFVHDIGELKRLEQIRKDFVANVSHELRTPLASIKAFAETLGAVGVDEEQRAEFVREIESSADRMTRLVDDLLSLSALEAGRMPPAFEPLELRAVVAEVAAALKPLAARKSVVLKVEPLGDLPRVRADRGQLKQVLTNLIDNAIKYAPEAGLVRLSGEASSDRVILSVSDNGPGVPAEDLPRLFERFYRVDKARSRELGGTGLGLSIVKHIVELHGGSVAVDSKPGAGATFRVALPAIK